jgi:hypothetical protein
MTISDIRRIEQALGITLPEAYRQRVVPFPVPCLAGNHDCDLWDDPEALIALNRQLRAGGQHCPAWPSHLFAVGQIEGDPPVKAIDLRAPDTAPVWWADHVDPNAPGSGETDSRFDDWANQYVADLRRDLRRDGFDPDASPSEHQAIEARMFRQQRWMLLVLPVVVIGLIIIYALIRRYI